MIRNNLRQWFLFLDDKVSGPCNFEEIFLMLRSGKIDGQTQLCLQGTKEWFHLSANSEMMNPAPVQAQYDATRQQLRFRCPKCRQKYAVSVDDAQQSAETFAAECKDCHALMAVRKNDAAAPEPVHLHPADAAEEPAGTILGGNIECPHCWKRFSSGDLLYVSTHNSLIGDPVLGQFAQKRFAPTVYNADGLPLDAQGMPCSDMACPFCHLVIPSSIIDEESTFISIVGAPSAGKSYYLTSLVHQLRGAMHKYCGCSFADADPVINQVVNSYENQLFFSGSSTRVATLKKTDVFGPDFTDQINMHGLEIQLPKPFIFQLQSPEAESELNRNVIFYDNAGELFQPGMDTAANPGTQHLASSDGIIFLFDPLNDARMRRICDRSDPQMENSQKLTNQTTFFAEMVARIRRHKNVLPGNKYPVPLIVLVGKYDNWHPSFEFDLRKLSPCPLDEKTMEHVLDQDMIASVSFSLRQLLIEYCPGLVSQAESFFRDVTYLPCSSFGRTAERLADGDSPAAAIGIAPQDIDPIWVDVPFFLLLNKLGMFRAAPSGSGDRAIEMLNNHAGLVFKHPVTGERVQLPESFAGRVLTIAGIRYRLPGTGGPTADAAAAEKRTDW